MKYIKRSLLMMALALILSSSLLYSTPVQASAANAENTSEESNLDIWLNTCLTMGKKLHSYGFRYSNSGTRSTFKRALSSRRKSNCALYVSWCLQEYGAVKKGQTFYIKGHGRIKKNFSRWNSNKVKVIKVYKKCSSTKLQAGDIVCWSGTPHTCIYAGRNSSGERTWFDGGKVSTYGNSSGSRYKSFKARHLGYLDHRRISYIIRIKDL